MKYEPYPRSLYRQVESGAPENVFEGVQCEIVTVESEGEETAAKKAGWHNSPAEAGSAATKPARAPKATVPAAEKAAKEPSPLTALRKEFKELSGNNPSPRATAEQLSEKIAALKANA